ncbi:MAG TPA: glycosyltransferase family 1 protein [Patescibacteria group bacterium]
MINVLFDTSPLGNAHAHRGIGMYTRFLTEYLEKEGKVTILRPSADDQGVKPDVVHYPYFDLFFSTLPFFHKAKKAVVTIHDVIPLKFKQYYRPGIKGSLRYRKQRLALRKISAIITDSQASKSDIINELGIPEHKIHVVYLAANPELQKVDEKTFAKVKKLHRLPKKYLLYVGDINYNKNIPQLIKALKFLPDDLHLVLAGKNFTPQDIPEWQWLETQMALSNVAERVHFVSDFQGEATEEISALYTGAEVYVQPSLAEGFGLPVLEAMQCRAPVVCSRTSSLIEVGGEHVVFAEPTAESLAESITQVLEWSQTKRDQWLRDAYKWSQTFSWQKTARETIKVYHEILS